MVKHKHHIVPRHMGGTDDLSNLMEVSVEEHAELHLALYLEHGKWQDWLAFHGLIGLHPHAEHLRLVSQAAAFQQWERELLWCNDGKTEMRVESIPVGWKPGRLSHIGEAVRKRRKGKGSLLTDKGRVKMKSLMEERNRTNNPMTNRIWITDDVNSKVWDKSAPIPTGWRKGRVINKKER